jgi:hypothetical protein
MSPAHNIRASTRRHLLSRQFRHRKVDSNYSQVFRCLFGLLSPRERPRTSLSSSQDTWRRPQGIVGFTSRNYCTSGSFRWYDGAIVARSELHDALRSPPVSCEEEGNVLGRSCGDRSPKRHRKTCEYFESTFRCRNCRDRRRRFAKAEWFPKLSGGAFLLFTHGRRWFDSPGSPAHFVSQAVGGFAGNETSARC